MHCYSLLVGLGQTGLGVLPLPASIASVIVTVCTMAQPSAQVEGLGGLTSVVSSSRPSQYLTPALNSQGPWTPSCPVSQGAYFLVPSFISSFPESSANGACHLDSAKARGRLGKVACVMWG